MGFLQPFKIELDRIFYQIWRNLYGFDALSQSQVTKNIFLGGQYDRRGLVEFQKLGITGILSLRTIDFIKAIKDFNFHTLLIPVRDRHAPTFEDLHTGIAFMEQEINSGGKVYVHCHAGEGRSATMVIAYLMKTGITYNAAFTKVKQSRSFICPSPVQVVQLHKFEQSLHSAN